MIDWRDEDIDIVNKDMFDFYILDDPKYWAEHIVLSFCDDLEFKSHDRLTARMIFISSNEEVTNYSLLVDTLKPQNFVKPETIFSISINNDSPSVVITAWNYKQWARSGHQLIEKIKEILQMPETQTIIKKLYTAVRYGDGY
jgi:hypothetical protein